MVEAADGDHRRQVQSLAWQDPLEKGMSTQVFLPGKSHGQRNPGRLQPVGHKESDTT